METNMQNHETTTALMKNKERQIKEILNSGDITYGMAKSIIQKTEAELLEKGNTFLNKSELKNVFPLDDR